MIGVEAALRWLDLAGIAVFAASGALVASRKQMDAVGFILVAAVTGFGGGTLRDIDDADWDDLPDLGSAFTAEAAWRHEVARLGDQPS